MKLRDRSLADFWQEFVANYWEQKAHNIKDPFGAPLVSSEELFQALWECKERLFAGEVVDSPLFFIDNKLQTDIIELLPNADDNTLAGYAARLEDELQGQRFALYWPEFQINSPVVWRRLREFFLELYPLIGLPGRTADCAIFLGNYQLSPQGVHNDATGIFLYQIEGSKTIHVWPSERLPEIKTKAIYDFDPYLDRAINLAGEPGDLLYWPRSYWHIGENLKGFSASLSLALWPNQTPLELTIAKIRELAVAHMPDSAFAERYDYHNDLNQLAQQLPAGIEVTLSRLVEIIASDNLRQVLHESWLNRLSGSGFLRVPRPQDGQMLAETDLVESEARFPILWIANGSDWLVCSANGHSFKIGACTATIEMLARINKGGQFKVGELLDYHCNSAGHTNTCACSRKTAQQLLEKLLSLRAIKCSVAKISKS